MDMKIKLNNTVNTNLIILRNIQNILLKIETIPRIILQKNINKCAQHDSKKLVGLEMLLAVCLVRLNVDATK